MTNSRSLPVSRRRRAIGVLSIVLGVLLAAPAAAAGFLGAAVVSDAIPVLALAAAVSATLACGLPIALGTRHLSRLVPALVTTATLLVIGIPAGIVLTGSLGHPAGPPPAADVRYWDLPTGSRLAYTMEPARGPRRDSPVVMLHGGPGTPGDGPGELGRVLAAKGFDVYAYDQLGAGRSTRLADPTGYTVARHLADLEAVRQRLGASRLTLVGGSWGATLGAEYLAAHPGNVAAAVFVSPGAMWAPEWRASGQGEIWDRLTPAQQAGLDQLESAPKLAVWSLLMDVNPRAAHALIPDAELDPIFDRLLAIAGSAATCHPDRPLTAPASQAGFYVNQLTSADEETRPDPRPALAEVHVPALVLRGECDYKRWEIAREYRDAIPGARLLSVPDAGHVIEAERPDVYLGAISSFLTGAALPLPAYTDTSAPTP